MTEAPQDDPPDTRTAVVATIRLLRAVHERLSSSSDGDLRLRIEALRDALIRLHRHLDDEEAQHS